MTEYDAIIIGAGLSGLSLGALLASSGKKIAIFEKNDRIGGRCQIYRREGFTLDWGVHFSRGAASKIFKELGYSLSRGRLPFRNGFLLEDLGNIYQLPQQVRSLMKNRCMKISEISKLSRKLLSILPSNYKKLYNVSVASWLKQINATKNMIDTVKFICMILLIAPKIERTSLGEFCQVVRTMNIKGIGRGTFHDIIGGLYAIIKKNDGQLHLKTNVKELICSEKKISGIITDNAEYLSKTVICANGPKDLLKLIDNNLLPEKYVSFIKKIRQTAGISIDFALKKKIYNELGFFTLNPAIMSFFESNMHPEITPKGKQLFTLYNIMDYEEVEDKKFAKRRIEQLFKLIYSVFPKMEKNVEWTRILHLKTVDGAEPNIYQYGPLRPNYIVPNLKNLYVIGDATRAQGTGGDIAFNSALDCYKLLKNKHLI
ncbi:MAG: phytoene desaturase family protein [Candidatus Helarchaeota archaeon]